MEAISTVKVYWMSYAAQGLQNTIFRSTIRRIYLILIRTRRMIIKKISYS